MNAGRNETNKTPVIFEILAIPMTLTYPGLLFRAVWPMSFDWFTVTGITLLIAATAFSLYSLTANPLGSRVFYGSSLVCAALFILYLLLAFERNEYWPYLALCAVGLLVTGAILMLHYLFGHRAKDRATARNDMVSVFATMFGFFSGIVMTVLSLL